MTGRNKPNLVDAYTMQGVNYRTINYNIIWSEEEFHWDSVEIPMTKFDYGGIVDSLISYRFPNDKMQAIINNYLLDPNDAYAIDEFNKMQAWRKEAKEIAKQALEYELP